MRRRSSVLVRTFTSQSRAADIEHWSIVRVHQLESVAIRDDLDLGVVCGVWIPANHNQPMRTTSRAGNLPCKATLCINVPTAPLSYCQTAAVILGILFAASILSSSNPCLPRRPAVVLCSTVRAETDFNSTSPPKKRERSAKCVACSIIGPCDWLLSHQPSLTAYSLRDDTVVEISERIQRQRRSTHYAMVYLALVAITVKLFSRKISLPTSMCPSVEFQQVKQTHLLDIRTRLQVSQHVAHTHDALSCMLS